MNSPLFDLLIRVLESGLFVLLGIALTTIANRNKIKAETEKAQAETKKIQAENKKLMEESERLDIENQNLKLLQMNSVMKENNELLKAKEELKAKLHISNEENLLLQKELSIYRIELSDKQKKFEELLANQQKEIIVIKQKTGQLPAQMQSREQK